MKRKDWKDVDQIECGFSITHVAEDTKAICHQLVSDNGEIKKAPKDYSVRKGLTEEPLTMSNQHHICITHSRINVMTWFLKVLCSCLISFESWIEKSTVLGEPICKSKDRVRGILENVGLIVDQVSGANAKTGTSNDGNRAQ